jgi:hypothetical protein
MSLSSLDPTIIMEIAMAMKMAIAMTPSIKITLTSIPPLMTMANHPRLPVKPTV